ncbi:MAG: sigma-70 family RNA polymerase sigma factor [Cyclobacteriaceae bacterium]|nr:sigma-70 family RNA polymerase sigma factor [Cyclobacteriaceae bacterium]UYN86583.1 MAG: sigma-70 family RNA polymerase sigma factor [Cyclobacteriaceae bacterium]
MLFNKPITEITDQELLQRYQATGNVEVLGYLYTRYTALVYGVCLKYLKDRDEAKDAVMNVFEKLIRALLEHEITHFKSWLYVTARNHCLMHLRANKNKQTEELSPFLMESDGYAHLEDATELEGNLVKLEKCIEKLGEEQQRCVRLFFLQQKCYQEIGMETGYDLKKVKSHIQNGKRNLKICLERHE